MTEWYYTIKRKRLGPISLSELLELFDEGFAGPNTLVWHPGMEEWQKASTIEWQKASTLDDLVPPQAAQIIRPEFQIGQTVKHALIAFKARWKLTALTSLLSLLLVLTSAGVLHVFRHDCDGVTYIVSRLGDVCVVLFGQAMVSYGALESLRGNNIGLARIIHQILRRAAPLMALCLAQLCINVVLPWTILTLLVPLLPFLPDPSTFTFLMVAILIFVLTTAIQTPLYVALPVCIIKGQGPIACLIRSAGLTENCRWKLFAILLLTTAPLTLIPSAFFPTAMFYAQRYSPMPELLRSSFMLFGIFFYFNLTAFLTTATYLNLRRAKEGLMDSDFADVFD